MINLLFTYLLTDIAVTSEASSSYSIVLTALLIVGFIAAVTIGSIAWYNSKRPLGWEDKQRPDVVPEIDK
ncbi:photosystem II assembly protein Psb35 [Nostoc sp. C117]|uniref:photosystem II assembly protein Psb35 n=1 Tax=Nostoc sp. C117 TaxID=3349875 RepID=UPI00370D9A6F